MADFIEFVGYTFGKLTQMLFNLSLGGYTYGSMLVAIIVVDIFISAIVLSFGRRIAGSAPSSGGKGGNSDAQ